jgi:hypothetical protein
MAAAIGDAGDLAAGNLAAGKFDVCTRKRARLFSLFQMTCQYTCQQRMLLTRRIQALAGRRGR